MNRLVILFLILPLTTMLYSQELLEIEGAITISDSSEEAPEEGTIRWNPETKDFEGFDGTNWISFTRKTGWGKEIDFVEDEYVESDDIAAGDYFSYSIDADQDLLVVGSYRGGEGVVHIFKYVDGNWSQIFEVLPPELDDNEFFGRSVAVSNNFIVIGVDGQSNSSSSDVGNGPNTGSAYIYHYDGTNLIEEAHLFSPGSSPTDDYGKFVAIDNDFVAVSAIGNNLEEGTVYIYRRLSSSWSLDETLNASDGFAGNYFGRSVSIKGTRVLIGADANNVGKAYVYRRIGAHWGDEKILVASDGASNNYFGFSVALSENTAMIGAFGKGDGAVYAFKRNVNDWSESTIITAPGSNPGSRFGISLSILDETAVIGAERKIFDSTITGAAYVFCENGQNWSMQALLKAEDGQQYDFFGRHVDITPDYIMCSGTGVDGVAPNTNSGRVFMFDK